MSENLIELVSPQLSAPVDRKPGNAVAAVEDGAEQSIFKIGPFSIAFAEDDDD
ncbi:hypothetical protein OOZ19_03010 [Saccharopolyspora sp. NFXS83]|uniref:hypothetical protein n=1 Tax=Saccharopolyspora sp. NFXS83 TaxID=2993560 RepID=UPI00224BA04B|nr:hypothetical protein [Saccharopolyspora sp. NFXS83]MCX2729198.1 hypothetical protein [Saccharopolyspora sp. NFXS83]